MGKTAANSATDPDNSPSPRPEIASLLQIARKHRQTAPQKTIQTCLQIISACQSEPDPAVDLAEVLVLLGNSFQTTCQHQKALEAFLHAQELCRAKADQPALGNCLIHIAAAQTSLKNFPEALSDSHHSLEIAQQTGDKILEGQSLNTLGMIYLELHESFKGLSYVQQSRDLLEEIGSQSLLGQNYNNLCRAYLELGNPDKALPNAKQAVRSNQAYAEYHQMTIALLQLSQVYHAQNNLEHALKACGRALETARKYGYKCEESTALCLISELHLEQKDFRKARKLLNESLELTQEFSQHPNYAETHRLLADLYEQQKKHQQALQHHQQYHAAVTQRYQRDLDNRVKVLELANNLEIANKISKALQEQNQALKEEVQLRQQAQSKLEEISRLDPLTGIYNRRHFFEIAELEYNRAKRYQHPLSAIMIDLDYFKQINDTHGHAVGDQVLTEIAQRIAISARAVDIVCRYGGEEFIVLLPETGIEDARILATRIWEQLTAQPMITSKLSIPVKASAGVACCQPESPISLDELIDHADQALYKAKQLGRNRIEIWP